MAIVISAGQVEAAAAAGWRQVELPPGAVVTPSARDRARELGIALGSEPLPPPAWRRPAAPDGRAGGVLTVPSATPAAPAAPGPAAVIVAGAPAWTGRPYVKALDTMELPWRRMGSPGQYQKILSRDPTTRARTALAWLIPDEGLVPQGMAHYHSTYEEILIVLGSLSFNSQDWLRRLAYCWHPPRTVHGFKSSVVEPCIFLSRVGHDLDVNYVEQPVRREVYNLDLPHEQMSRPPAYVYGADPDGWQDVRDRDGKVVMRRKLLSVDRTTGEGSMLVRFLPGFKSPHGRRYHTVYEESFVLEGELVADDGTRYLPGFYRFQPPYHVYGPSSSETGALVYINFGGKLDFRPA